MSENTAVLSDVVADYAAADRKGKARLRANVESQIRSILLSGNVTPETMAEAMTLQATLSAMTSTRPTAPPVDYVQAIADHRATLVAAIAAIDAGQVTLPEGVAVPDYDADDVADGTAGDVAPFVRPPGRKAGRGNVQAYVETVLHDVDAGTIVTIRDLRAAWDADSHASLGYPTQPPSAGAIAAMLDRDGHPFTVTVDNKGTKAIEA